MTFEKCFYRLSTMPPSTINIQPNGILFQPAVHMLQNFNKTCPIPTFCLDHTDTSQQRCYPPRYVQSLLMLTGRHNSYPLPNARPSSAQPRMQGKAAFILKYDGLMITQSVQFFLTPCETPSHLQSLPGCKNSLHVSGGNQVRASNSGPVELSSLSQTVSVNDLPEWDHPIGHVSNQNRPGNVPDVFLTALPRWVSLASVFPVSISPLKIQARSHSIHAHTCLRSYGLTLILQKSIPGVDLRSSITMPLSLNQSLHQGSPWLMQLTLSSLLQIDRWLMFSCIKHSILCAFNITVFIAFVLVMTNKICQEC